MALSCPLIENILYMLSGVTGGNARCPPCKPQGHTGTHVIVCCWTYRWPHGEQHGHNQDHGVDRHATRIDSGEEGALRQQLVPGHGVDLQGTQSEIETEKRDRLKRTWSASEPSAPHAIPSGDVPVLFPVLSFMTIHHCSTTYKCLTGRYACEWSNSHPVSPCLHQRKLPDSRLVARDCS